MKIEASLIPDVFMQLYNLHSKVYKEHIWICIDLTISGLPQTGVLSNQLLKKPLALDG